MIKPMRTFLSALFIMSAICVVSCNRDWNDCCSSPCEMKCSNPCEPCAPCEPECAPCSPKCDPCAPVCEPCCKEPRNCTPCCKTPRCFRDDCSDRCAPCREDCAQPCAPEANPYYPCDPSFFPCGSSNNCEKPFPEEVCYGRMAVYKTCDDCVVDLCQRAPEYATVGAPYPIEITITARKECAEVVVNQTLPCESVFVKSEPAATPDKDHRLSWHFPHLTCGETQRICVWVKPEREGCCLAAATVCACPQLCAYTKCGQPIVCIKKYGPACACLYCPVPYRIEVCNTGSATAYDVVVQDAVPEGLTHASGYRCLNYELGTLCPGESKTINLEFCASRAGSVTNMATVSFCGGAKCSAEATTLVNEPCVQVSMTGADWAYICKEVDFVITVTNPGSMVLRDVVIDDVTPAGTTVCGAPGAEICCNRAVWCLPELCPGETKTFTVTVCSQVAGNLTNQVSVTTQSDCGPCSMCAEATTQWRGIPATHMCMVDTVDPICVGDNTVYRICVTNRGTADDTNVALSVNFSEQLSPQSANGPTKGTVSGNTVTFAPIERLAPKQSMEFCITVKGVSVGDARAEAVLSSDLLTTPVTDVESTHVY